MFCLFLGIGLALCLMELGNAHTYGKLLAALGTLEDQLLTILVLRFVKYYIVIAFGATYAFHSVCCLFFIL